MSETKHTPGPWRIKDDGETSKIADAANNTIASLSYVHLYGRRTAAEVNANMHLIAAAPDYDDGAQCFIRWVAAFGETLPPDTLAAIEAAFGAKLRAASAKAEGRS